MKGHTYIYYKIDIVDLTQAWIDASQSESINSSRRSAYDVGTLTSYVLLKFKESNVPLSLYVAYLGEDMSKSEALAELGGSIWQ